MSDEWSEPELINAVLTFVDSDGRTWLSGAFLGPLCAESNTDVRLSVLDMLDRALTLTSFKVVHDDRI